MSGLFVEGIDVSHHQGKIDFAKVAADGVRYVLMKASEGATFKDPKFTANWTAAKKTGLKCGAYHFFRPSVSGATQAANFVSELKKVGFSKGDIIPTVDCEDFDGSSKSAHHKELADFLTALQQAFSVRSMIYTLPSFWSKIGNPTTFGSHPLWVVDLSSVGKPRLPPGWTDYAIWQYSFHGKIDGISGSVDLDRLKGDLTALNGLCL